jgi:peptidoglycan/LPS O-acetylase OafA/YrhL
MSRAVGGHQSRAFQPEIQGLRAIAVLAVLMFHIWPSALAGGYVGVDVFFVISGYLITGLLLREFKETGSLDLASFYARRVRRLLPAAALVLFAVAALSGLLPSVRLETTGIEILASTFYVQNWWLASQAVDYLAADDAPSILLHFWSLSVEEQYYIFWPIMLVSVAAVAPRVRPKEFVFGAFVALVFFLSIAYSVYATSHNPGLAYFATTTRAWELALGGLVACFVSKDLLSPAGKSTATAVGLAMIALAAYYFDERTPFPGFFALLPTVGAALVIAGCGGESRYSLNPLLTSRAMQYVGDISYSLYLWHWPILILYGLVAARQMTTLDGGVVAVISFALAHQTKDLVEDRYRHPGRVSMHRKTILTVVACFAVSITSGAWVYVRSGSSVGVVDPKIASSGHPGGAALLSGVVAEKGVPYIPSANSARADKSDAYGKCIAANGQSEPYICHYGVKDASVRIAIVGDSHAVHWFPALREAAKHNGWAILGIAKSACAFGSQPVQGKRGTSFDDCTDWSRNALELLKEVKPDLVISAQSIASMAVGADDKERSAELIGKGLAESWRALLASGIPVLAIKDTPWMGANIPDCLSKPGAQPDDCARPRTKAVGFRPDPMDIGAKLVPRVTLLDVSSGICGPSMCEPVVGNVLVWRDSHHLTATFSRTLAPYLGIAVKKAMQAHNNGSRIVWKSGSSLAPDWSPDAKIRPHISERVDASTSKAAQEKVDLSVEHDVLYDRIGKTSQGRRQREIFILVKDVSYADLLSQLKAAMQHKGYKLVRERPSKGGTRLDFAFGNERAWSAHVTSADVRPMLVKRGATAAVYLTWAF